MNIKEWTGKENESVEDMIQMLVKVYGLDADTVVSAIRREANMRDYYEKEEVEGRPSKQKEYFNRMKDVIDLDHDRDTKIEELNNLIEEMEEKMSRSTRYKTRNRINKHYGVYIKKPLHNLDDKDIENLLDLTQNG